MNGATNAIANDIDPYALAASKLNIQSNIPSATASGFTVSDQNLLSSPAVPQVDIAFIGDMFYDSDMGILVRRWIKKARGKGVEVFVGDPGRHALKESEMNGANEGDISLEKAGEYELVREEEEYLEENAFERGVVWRAL